MNDLPPAFFIQTGHGIYEPTEATIGPWSPHFQHGGPPSALLTHALRTYQSTENLKISRIIIEILRTIHVKPCEIKVQVVRGGKRVELLRAEYISAGKTYMIAHAWRLLPEAGVTSAISDSYEIPLLLEEPQLLKPFPGVTYFPYGEAID